jgi:dolichol-phosphate mannosyltransferase
VTTGYDPLVSDEPKLARIMVFIRTRIMPNASAYLPVELSIVVPTFNERDNVEKLIEHLECTLPDVRWEVIFVDDDSLDGTAEVVCALAQSKPYVRCLQRIGRRGLSRAVIEGDLSEQCPRGRCHGCRPPT